MDGRNTAFLPTDKQAAVAIEPVTSSFCIGQSYSRFQPLGSQLEAPGAMYHSTVFSRNSSNASHRKHRLGEKGSTRLLIRENAIALMRPLQLRSCLILLVIVLARRYRLR